MKSIRNLFRSILGVVLLLSACSPAIAPTQPVIAQPAVLSTAVESVTHTAATAEPASNSAQVTPIPSQFPDPAGYTWNRIAGGFDRADTVASAGDGSGRLFILEQAGTIRVVNGNKLEPAPFLDISDRVGSRGNEQGLLGIAFHPNFNQNGYFFVDFTDRNGNTVIARFTAPTGKNADPASELVILQVKQPFPNHNGGQLVFGPDHYLWIGLGDGGSQGDPNNNGQSLDTLLGKILRLDVDHASPYAIPKDNPFASGGGRPELWAYGLRNPWRVTFDRQTGDLFIADVGQDLWEEIDYLPAG